MEAIQSELVSARTDMTFERDRRERAEAQALRADVRLETLEQLLVQLKPDEAGSSHTSR